MENLEGIADRGYSNDEEILQCLLNGDTIIQHTGDVFFCQCTRPGFGGICFIQFFHVPADFFFHIQKNLLGIAADITFIVSIYRSGENHICTTDPESRLMKTRDGIRPSFNVQTS